MYDQLFTRKPRTPPPKPTEPKAPPSFVKEKTKEQEEEMKQKRKRMRTGPPSLFNLASLPLLEALLGKEALPTLHELELEQWRRGGKRGAYALKADVEKLLQKKSLRENLAVALKDSISYKHVVPSTRPALFSEEEEEEEEELDEQ